MVKKEIGVVTIHYNEAGVAYKAEFIPALQVNLDQTALEPLIGSSAVQEEDVMQQADTVLAAWFNQLNDMELADREKYRIAGKVQYCGKTATGKISTCSIEYSFDEVP